MSATLHRSSSGSASPFGSRQLAQLKERFPAIRPAVLVALDILLSDPDVAPDDAKARAALQGVRITAASLTAARKLMARMSNTGSPAAPAASPARAGRPARDRRGDGAVDAESLVRNLVANLQSHGNAEVERMRDAIRRAIGVLQAAVGD
jgi:hypothetical protein